ncbi:DnaD domain protein [Paenibacillus sp. HB172176]|uniref:DnaD domain protein n=1 Tax=Paenibacillus sp. HB172176 TaxID=2493690 RepID=UPI001F0F3A0D|nr:DnaD domain protein [Paenibacillus sp. HB172176]
MNDEIWKAYAHGMGAAMNNGGIYVNSLLLTSYSPLGLSETSFLLLLHIKAYAESEQNEFPTPQQLSMRMGRSKQEIEEALGRLMKDGFLSIDDYVDEISGRQAERYNWSGWLRKSAELFSVMQRSAKKTQRKTDSVNEINHINVSDDEEAKPKSNLFSTFEQEFGRLLSPMECETISSWLDQDRYTEEIILFALKESVFAGKLSLRYIDRILIEWSRNRITNAEEARAHSQKFHSGRR